MIKKKNNFSFYLIIGILCFPFIVNVVMVLLGQLPNSYKFIFANDLGNKEWLSFWGSYLSGIATFVSVYVMYRMNEKIMLNQKKEAIYNHEKEKLNELKKIILKVLEAFDITIFIRCLKLGDSKSILDFKVLMVSTKDRILKEEISLELCSEINLIDEIMDTELKKILLELKDVYTDLSKEYEELLDEFYKYIEKAEVFKSLKEEEIKLYTDQICEKYLNNKITTKYEKLKKILQKYLLYKEKLIEDQFRG